MVSVARDVLTRIDEELLKRFNIQDYHIAATLLDPEIKNASWLDQFLNINEETSSHLAKKEILNHFCDVFRIVPSPDCRNDAAPVPAAASTVNPIFQGRLRLLSSLGVHGRNNNAQPPNHHQTLDAEIDSYLNLSLGKQCLCPMTWWAENSATFPNLKQLFDDFLSVASSSASSEVAFKSASKFLRHDRANLNPIKVNKFCFNIQLLEENGNIYSLKKITDL